jgi:hypothetical protein
MCSLRLFHPQDFSMMRLPPFLLFALLVALPAFADQKQAISATVTGDDQQVGFRAMVMKQAIEYNLAGFACGLRFRAIRIV